MTTAWILAAVGFLLALAFDLVPGLRSWWDKLPEEGKRWGWLVGCVGIPIALWGAACYGNINLWGFDFNCDMPGFIEMLVLGLTAFLTYFSGQVGHALGKLGERRFYKKT